MDNNEKKSQFHEALAFLVESANINSGTLTIQEIKLALGDLIEDESMFDLVYNYLLENKITVQGYIPAPKKLEEDSSDASEITVESITSDTSDFDDKEKNILSMYYEELSDKNIISDEEELSIIKKLLDGTSNKEEINRLTEKKLKAIIDLANTFVNKGVSIADLIQEGNLALFEGIIEYNLDANLDSFNSYLNDKIVSAMNNAILAQDSSSRTSAHAADRANELDRASVALSKELDRTPTIEELAKYLSLPENEVEQVMKMSLNALTIEAENPSGDAMLDNN